MTNKPYDAGAEDSAKASSDPPTKAHEIVDEVIDAFEAGYGKKPDYAKRAGIVFSRLLYKSTLRNLQSGALNWDAVKEGVLKTARKHGERAKSAQDKEKESKLELYLILDTFEEIKAEFCPQNSSDDRLKMLGLICQF